MKLSAKLFIVKGEKYVLGPGRVELLRAVAELGSLRKAAQKFGMSYRWAWGRMTDAEKSLGIPLLVQDGTGKAKTLSPQARELLDWFTAVERSVAEAMEQSEAARPEFLQ